MKGSDFEVCKWLGSCCSMNVQDLLDLKLHEFAEDVSEVVDQSVKEVHLGCCWASRDIEPTGQCVVLQASLMDS